MPFLVYKATNAVNGKSYIGVTRQAPERRWWEHRNKAKNGVRALFYDALRKYGQDAFTFAVVASAFSVPAMYKAEREIIAQEGTMAPHGYNNRLGVPLGAEDAPPSFALFRRTRSRESYRLMGLKLRGRRNSEETRARKCEAQRKREQWRTSPLKGRSLSDDVRRSRAARKSGLTSIWYAGVEYPSRGAAATAAGVMYQTMRRWVRLFGARIPYLSEEERYCLRHGCRLFAKAS